MDDELVLLTSYFNLADGRRQDTADTFRVDSNLPSATAPGGAAALYIVTETSAGGNMGMRARRRAVDTIGWEYSTHGDEPPATRLRAALKLAHEEVFREFDGHVAVGLSVVAVEGNSIYLGQVAPAQVYVLHEGSLHSISATAPGTSPFSRALGSNGRPQISVFRDEIAAGDVVSLCSSWFNRSAEAEDLRSCFGAGTVEDITECLLDLAKDHDARDVTVITIEALLARDLETNRSQDEPPGFLEQVDTAVQALADVGRMLWQELRVVPAHAGSNGNRRGGSEVLAEAGVASGSHPVGAVEIETADSYEPESPAPTWDGSSVREQATDEVPIVLPMDDEEDPLPPPRKRDTDRPTDEVPIQRAAPKAERRAPPISEMEQVNSRLHEAPDMTEVIPPVQAFPDTSTEPERIYATNKDVQAANRRPRRLGGVSRPETPPVIRPAMRNINLERPANLPAPPAVVWATLGVVLVLALGAFYLFFNHRHTTTNPYPGLARQDIRLAQAAKTPASQDLYLTKARTNINRARAAGAKPAAVRKLNVQLQQATDLLHHITRVTNPVVLTDFSHFPGAQPSEIATAPGLVFVLDTGRKAVFSITPNASSNPSEIVQAGETDNGFTFGLPQHVATDGPIALVLDNQNVLIRDAGGNKTATSLNQPSPEQVVGMQSSDPDVYLLDTKNSQLWRYPYGVTAYSPAAAQYFASNGPNLSQAVSFTMDGTDLFILNANGTVLKFDSQANPQKFAVNLHTPLSHPVSIFTDHGLPFVWIADPAHGRILQLDKNGGYVRTYRANHAVMDLRTVKSMAVGPAGNTLYVLAGSKLYDFPVVH